MAVIFSKVVQGLTFFFGDAGEYGNWFGCEFCEDILVFGILFSTVSFSTEVTFTKHKFGKSLNISLIFHWNISPAGAIPNGNLINMYLLNYNAKMVRYEDFLIKLQVMVS